MNLAPTKFGVMGTDEAGTWIKTVAREDGTFAEEILFKEGDRQIHPAQESVYPFFNNDSERTLARIGNIFHELLHTKDEDGRSNFSSQEFYAHRKEIYWASWHPSGNVVFEAEDGIFFLYVGRSAGILWKKAKSKLIVSPEKKNGWQEADDRRVTHEGIVYRRNTQFFDTNKKRVWSIPPNQKWDWKWKPFAIGVAHADSAGVITYHDWKRPQSEVLYENLGENDQWIAAPHSQIVIVKADGEGVLVGRRVKIHGVPTTILREEFNLSATIGLCYEIGIHPMGAYARVPLSQNKGTEAIYGIVIK
ncbi:MAG: hypothetical protein WC757_04970 [Candidatus Paceibacterota bacterium]|jgi:hypothetical protein